MKKNKVTISRAGEEYTCRYVLDASDVVDTKVDMGTTGKFQQIVPHTLEEHDGQREFVYQIGRRVPLTEFMKKEFNKEQMLELQYNVLAGLESFGMNMISLSYVAKEMRCVFVDPETRDVSFVVAAVDKEMTDLNEVKELMQAILVSASYFEMDRDNYVAKLITFTNRKGTFSISDMKKYVNDMLMDMGINIEDRKKKPAAAGQAAAAANGKVSRVGVMQNQARIAPQMPQGRMMPQGQPMPTPNGMPMQGRPMPQGQPMPTPNGMPMQGRPMPQGQPMPTPNGMPMQGRPVPQGQPMPTPNGMPMQGRPVPQGQPMPTPNGMPMQGRPMPQGQPMPTPNGMPIQGRPMPQGQPMPTPSGMPMQGRPMPNGIQQPTPQPETKPQEAPTPQPETKPQEAPAPQPETKPQPPVPYLLRVSTNEKIYIDKPEFSLGRSTTKADYTVTDNTDVSRIHCIIERKNGVSYIKDNASTNGTFVNGQNIAGKENVFLTNKARVALGNEEFVYFVS